ncbi:hypothetical protein TNCV_1623401, partial [Trichonephila clavipes]
YTGVQKIKDEVEKLAYQLNEEAERTERPIRRLSQKQAADSGEKIARHTTGDWTTEIAFYRGQKTARWWSVYRRLYGVYTFNACPSEKAFSVVPGTPELRDNEWGRVLFTEESRFSLSSDSHRILIWESGEAAIIRRTSLKGTEALWVRSSFSWDDNVPCHRTVADEQLLESEDIERMNWPGTISGSQSHRACMAIF